MGFLNTSWFLLCRVLRLRTAGFSLEPPSANVAAALAAALLPIRMSVNVSAVWIL